MEAMAIKRLFLQEKAYHSGFESHATIFASTLVSQKASVEAGSVSEEISTAISEELEDFSTEFRRKSSPTKRFLLVIVGLWLLLYGSFTLFNPPLLDDADSVHAEVAREMIARHDPVTLYANGIRYLEKAPLLYWSMAASFKVFGVSDWAARIPMAFYSLALFFAVFLLGRRLFQDATAGFYAALILLTSFGVFIFTRITIPDAVLCLWLTLAMGAFWKSLAEERPSWRTALAFAGACALGVLTKGLIGVVFPVGIVVVFLLMTRNLGHLWRWHPVGGFLFFLVVAAPWHILAGLANPTQGHPVGFFHPATPTDGNVHGFFWFYFVNEQLLRYLNQRIPRDYDTSPLLFFWGLIFIWLMPWCAFLFKALGTVPWRSASNRAALTQRQSGLLLLAIWALLPLLFFSFSTRQEYYVLPALPALALLIAAWLAEDEQTDPYSQPALAGRRIAWMLLVLGWIGAAVAVWFALRAPKPAAGADLAQVLNQNPGDYALSFGHFLDLSTRAMGFFRGPLIDTAAAFFVGVAGNLFYRLRGRARYANGFLAGMAATFLIAAHLALQTFAPVLSSQTLALAIHRDIEPSDVLEIQGEYEAGSTMGFYLQRQVRILNGRSSNLWYGSFFSDAPKIFDDLASFQNLWSGPQRVFLWTETNDVPALTGPVYVIAGRGGKEILSNQPNQSGASF
jgi:4-amino-4-deoxy-L-arabinose transferase-like glycosyltransferase